MTNNKETYNKEFLALQLLKRIKQDIQITHKDRKFYFMTCVYNILDDHRIYMIEKPYQSHKRQCFNNFSHFYRSDFRSYLANQKTRIREKFSEAPIAIVTSERKTFKAESEIQKLSYHSHALVLIHESQIEKMKSAKILELDSKENKQYHNEKQAFVNEHLSCKHCKSLIYDIQIKECDLEIASYITKNDDTQRRSEKINNLVYYAQ